MSAIQKLRAVLCDQQQKCCIPGSNEDREVVDKAILEIESRIGKLQEGLMKIAYGTASATKVARKFLNDDFEIFERGNPDEKR